MAMKRGLHELSEPGRAQDQLMIPTDELGALFASGLLTLGLLFGPPTLASGARSVVLATVTTLSGAIP